MKAPITRRARDKDGTIIEPMTLGNMRKNGADGVILSCECGWMKSVKVSQWPDAEYVPDIGLRIACPRCGAPETNSQPNWPDRVYGRKG